MSKEFLLYTYAIKFQILLNRLKIGKLFSKVFIIFYFVFGFNA